MVALLESLVTVTIYFRLRWSDQLVDGVRLVDIPTRDIACMLDRPGLKTIKVQKEFISSEYKNIFQDKLAALERLSPLRQSDTYKMVNSRGMEMAVVRVGGFTGPTARSRTASATTTSTTRTGPGGSSRPCHTWSAATLVLLFNTIFSILLVDASIRDFRRTFILLDSATIHVKINGRQLTP